MTQSGQTPESDDALVPPTSTRWSEGEARESGAGEEGLVAPFVPGQSRRAERPEIPGAGTEGGPSSADAGAGAAAMGGTDERLEPEPADMADEPFPFDMPPSDTAEPVGGGGGAGATSGETIEEDDFPIEAFDFGPEATAGAPAGGAGATAGGGVSGAAGRSAVEQQVAERLEHLASRLRAEGAEGVERELASSDRLTSLLAALLAGHLASR